MISTPWDLLKKTWASLQQFVHFSEFSPSHFPCGPSDRVDQEGEAVFRVISKGTFHPSAALSVCLFLAVGFYQKAPAGLKGLVPASNVTPAGFLT